MVPRKAQCIPVVHVISGLGTGGAEGMLLKLVSTLDRRDYRSAVVSLSNQGPLGARFHEQGIEVHSLGMVRSGSPIVAAARLGAYLKARAPVLVHTWMYHADLLGGLMARMTGVGPLIWSVRCSAPTKILLPRTQPVMRLCALLSHWVPDVILFNSWAGLEGHQRAGYATRKLGYIPNGFDSSSFAPSSNARAEFRKELGLDEKVELIGMIARFMPEAKDHDTFLKAAAELASRRRNVRFVLCGDRVDPSNEAVVGRCRELGIEGIVYLLGGRTDIPRVTAALDLASLVSHTESFPNVVGEAMAAGIPCVVTDVGDCREIVGEQSLVVPPRNPYALSDAWLRLLEAGPAIRSALGATGRDRVNTLFDIRSVAARYATLYRDLWARKAPPLEASRLKRIPLYD